MMMWMLAKVGVKALLANKLRSFLAVLGIIIGVGAVISMLASAPAPGRTFSSGCRPWAPTFSSSAPAWPAGAAS
ncbi:MAG: hypothetical protein LUG50_05330 [Planctomycetaceae bacterium]|nr:hypothetical protein [Planctomycetaceae bacterium]